MAGTINQNISVNKNWFDRTMTIYIWILGVLLIYWILLKLTNHSPTIEQLTLVGVGILGGLLFKQQYDIGKLDGKFESFKDNCNKEFARIDNRFDKFEYRFEKVESRLSKIEESLSVIKLKMGISETK
ncbi:MAG: hypothetical protein AABX39_03460 [Nanoarchaeota archaeon]